MVASVDACAAALVREYLSRKGYKQALAALDGKRGLTERDLTSRADIVERLQLQPLVKQNRSQLDPVSTLLELILVSREKGLRASGANSCSGSSAGSGSGSSESDSDSDSNSNAPSQIVRLPPARGPAAAAAHVAAQSAGRAQPSPAAAPAAPATAPAPGRDAGFRVTCSDLAVADLRRGVMARAAGARAPSRFEGRRGERLLLPPGSVQGGACVSMVDCVGCELLLLDHSASVTLHHCHDCRVLIGPVDGSVMIMSCTQLRLAAVCRQLRCRECRACTLSLYTLGVALESCTAMQFSRWDTAYPGLGAHFKAAGFDSAGPNRWQQVYDFTPPTPTPTPTPSEQGGAGAGPGVSGEAREGVAPAEAAEAAEAAKGTEAAEAAAANWSLLPDESEACAALWPVSKVEETLTLTRSRT